MIKTCYNNGQKERLCLIIDKCRRQKLCKRAQKISAAAPLRVMTNGSPIIYDLAFIKSNWISCTWRSQYWYTSIVDNTGIQNYSSIVIFLQKKYNTGIKSYSSIVDTHTI